MASKTILKRGRAPRIPLDLPMAALAAISVAFVAWAMPDAFFAQAISGTGLPSVLPAAEPPLGQTARLAVSTLGAAATFALTWTLLRALSPQAPARRAFVSDPAAPRLRRADAHPDAPSRRPLFAEHELGEPVAETAFAAAPPVDDEVLELDELARFSPPMAEPEAPSLSHLMQRLELGLIRREGEGSPSVREDSEPAPFGHPVDRRLQSALADLQRMASRGSRA